MEELEAPKHIIQMGNKVSKEGQAGQETWAVRMSGTGNFSVRTRKNVIPVVRMDDWVVEVQLKKSQETILTCFLWIYNKIFFP